MTTQQSCRRSKGPARCAAFTSWTLGSRAHPTSGSTGGGKIVQMFMWFNIYGFTEFPFFFHFLFNISKFYITVIFQQSQAAIPTNNIKLISVASSLSTCLMLLLGIVGFHIEACTPITPCVVMETFVSCLNCFLLQLWPGCTCRATQSSLFLSVTAHIIPVIYRGQVSRYI